MESRDVEPVTPVPPLAGWIGGKRLLAPVISERLCLVPHRTYAEPFVGIGGLFFRRPWRSKAEVINDTPEIREIFKAFHLEEVETKYMIGNVDRSETVRELVFSNIALPAGSLL